MANEFYHVDTGSPPVSRHFSRCVDAITFLIELGVEPHDAVRALTIAADERRAVVAWLPGGGTASVWVSGGR